MKRFRPDGETSEPTTGCVVALDSTPLSPGLFLCNRHLPLIEKNRRTLPISEQGKAEVAVALFRSMMNQGRSDESHGRPHKLPSSRMYSFTCLFIGAIHLPGLGCL